LILQSAHGPFSPSKARQQFGALALIATDDDCFASWLSRHGPTLTRLPENITWLDWDQFLCRLIALDAECPKYSLIKDAASTALRLRSLERSFSEMLDQSRSKTIYHLAYGLSHELNNPLANITVRAGVLRQSTNDAEHLALLETIIENAARGSEMLGDLMLIAVPPVLSPKKTNLLELVAKIEERCRVWVQDSGLVLSTNWLLDGTAVLDEQYVVEAVWAVVRNAIEASRIENCITLKGYSIDRGIYFSVQDEGPGLSDDALKYCFDPFFSGREAGRGLGMGLTKAKRLATHHGGGISIGNLPVKGCWCTLWFQSAD
jgi:signal transduction histidine kinase